jgi:hypothetical protein
MPEKEDLLEQGATVGALLLCQYHPRMGRKACQGSSVLLSATHVAKPLIEAL